MQQWKTQVRITLNLNRITFGNVTACNLDFYRRSAVKGFIPLEKCEEREKLLMLMDFWKLQGLRKLCPLSLLSYAVLSITLAIKISSLAPPSFPHSTVTTGPLASPPLHLASLLPVLLCSFSQATSGPVLSPCQTACVVLIPLAPFSTDWMWTQASKFASYCLESAAQVSHCQRQDLCVLTLMLTAELTVSVCRIKLSPSLLKCTQGQEQKKCIQV